MHKVQKTLRDAGLAVWTDEGLEPGTPSWRSEIEEAVGQASAMVVLLSPNSKSSRWVDNEVGYAQTLGKAVFPVLIAGDNATAVPISLINTQWVDGRRQVDTVVRQRLLPAIEGLVRAPAVETGPSPEPAPPAARPWVWLGVGAAILIVAVLLGWWALANFGGFWIVGPPPNPSAMVGAEEVVPPVLSPTNTSTSTQTPEVPNVAAVLPTETALAPETPAVLATATPTVVPTAPATMVPPSIRKVAPPRDGMLHIEGIAEPGAAVEVSVDDRIVGSATADKVGQWQFDVQVGISGERVIEVVTSAGRAVTFVLIPESTATAVATLRPTSTPAVTATRISTNTATPTTTSTPISTPTRRPTPPSTPVPTATPTGTSAPLPAAGATRTNPKDGAIYVFVPAGPFIMGSSVSDPDALQDEEPQQPALYVDAFWIMQTEVTNAQYAKCVTAGACSEPSSARWNSQEYVQHPVTNVDWNQANAYAQWVGGRLPTEAEWEKACRGTDDRIYPWGDEPPTSVSANFNSSTGDTTAVGSYPTGASPYGTLDMAGNVSEWTSTKYSAYPYAPADGREDMAGGADRALRGGSWLNYAGNVRCANRSRYVPYYGNDYNGFRVLSPGF